MGHQTIVHGYIEIAPGSEAHNAQVIDCFDFDEVWPLRRVFSNPVTGYRAGFVSFADGLKATPDEWPEWRQRFEQLLKGLSAISARVDFAEFESSARDSYAYVFNQSGTGKDRAAHWTRWRLGPNGEELEETDLPA